jgi:multiple sugar transport system substrate-binding protein
MAGKRGQILYGLPLECSPTIMVVNTSILEKEKIEMPAMDWTWNDCYRICRQVTGRRENSSGYQFGISEYDWENCFYSNDVVLFSEDGSTCYLTDEKAGEAITFLDKLGRLAAKATNVQPSFSDGNVLFQPMSYSAYKAYISNPIHMGVGDDFTWQIHSMPAGPHGDNHSLLQTQLIAMNSQSSRKELAWELMKTLTADPEVQKEIYRYSEGISVLQDVTSADDTAAEQRRDEDTEILRIAMGKAVSRQRFRGKEEAGQQIGLAVDSILAGSGNIRMEQIIYNRRINRYLQQ